MKSDKLVCIRHTNGKVQRLPQKVADMTVAKDKAKFISKTAFKAANAGVVIRKGMSDSDIMTLVREARTPKKVEKLEEKKEPQPRQRRGKKRSEEKNDDKGRK